MFVLLPVTLLVWNLGVGSAADPYALSPDGHGIIFKLIELKDTAIKTNDSSCEEISNSTMHVLTLANKSLSTFPACLPSTLKVLNLSNNNLSLVDYDKLAELASLNTLNLSLNAISELNLTGEHFASLQILDVSFNLLSRVPTCHGIVNLKSLSLAGNPIKVIQPLAFMCMPYLGFLDLSSTLLGIDDGYGIGKSAFAVQATDGTTSLLVSNLTMLDLSGTYLGNIRQDWTEDLRNLRILYMSKMQRLKSLSIEEFTPLLLLHELICQDSLALSWIDTNIFKHTPHMSHLDFQNCNLTSFNHWNTVAMKPQTIILSGNPLRCTCELSRLLSKPQEILLLRANETTCSRTEGNGLSSLTLPELYDECQAVTNETVTEADDLTGATTPFYRNNRTAQAKAAPGITSTEDTTDTTTLFSRNNHTAQRAAVSGATSIKKITRTAIPFYRNQHSTKVPAAPGASSAEFATTYATVSATLHSTSSGLILHHNTAGDHYISNSSSTKASSAFTAVTTASPILPFEAITQLPRSVSSATTEGIKQNATDANTIKKRTTMAHIPRDYVTDFEDEEDEEEKIALPHKIVVCDYHPCKHLQTLCDELQKISQCYCPGLSPGNVIPDPPRLREVSEITDTSAQIQWCAPTSVVDQYQIVYHPVGSENQMVVDGIYVTARQYTLYKLSPDTSYQLCVIALNKAGLSPVSSNHVSRSPCTKFRTRPSYIIILAALCTTGGILLLATIILAAFLCRKQKGYFVDQYDTRLVSYRNPVFDNHLKTPTFN